MTGEASSKGGYGAALPASTIPAANFGRLDKFEHGMSRLTGYGALVGGISLIVWLLV